MPSADSVAQCRNLNLTTNQNLGSSSSSSTKKKTGTSISRAAVYKAESSSSKAQDKGKGKAEESLVPGTDTNGPEKAKKLLTREKLEKIGRGLEETEVERAKIQQDVTEAKKFKHEIRSSQQAIREKQYHFSSLSDEEQKSLNGMVQRLERLYEDAEEVNTQLLKELKDANEKISGMKIELNGVRNELKNDRRRSDSLQKLVDGLVQENETLKQQVAILVNDLDEMEEELAKYKKEDKKEDNAENKEEGKEDVDGSCAPVSPRQYSSSQVTKKGGATEDPLDCKSSKKKKNKGRSGNSQTMKYSPERSKSQEQSKRPGKRGPKSLASPITRSRLAKQ